MTITIESIVARWSAPDTRPLFKGELIETDENGESCYCAQGDILHMSGWSDDRLHDVCQHDADKEVARILGISRTHSVLLRQVNDSAEGCPQDVLAHPERILGDQVELVLAFWRRLDALTLPQWDKVYAASAAARAASDAWDAASAAARATARAAAGAAAWAAVREAARAAARDARAAAWAAAWDAAYASNEIQGAAIMRERRQDFLFLPMFGISDPEELRT